MRSCTTTESEIVFSSTQKCLEPTHLYTLRMWILRCNMERSPSNVISLVHVSVGLQQKPRTLDKTSPRCTIQSSPIIIPAIHIRSSPNQFLHQRNIILLHGPN